MTKPAVSRRINFDIFFFCFVLFYRRAIENPVRIVGCFFFFFVSYSFVARATNIFNLYTTRRISTQSARARVNDVIILPDRMEKKKKKEKNEEKTTTTRCAYEPSGYRYFFFLLFSIKKIQ